MTVEALAKATWDRLYTNGSLLLPWDEAQEADRQAALRAARHFMETVTKI